jgi:hypothetical protein
MVTMLSSYFLKKLMVWTTHLDLSLILKLARMQKGVRDDMEDTGVMLHRNNNVEVK